MFHIRNLTWRLPHMHNKHNDSQLSTRRYQERWKGRDIVWWRIK